MDTNYYFKRFQIWKKILENKLKQTKIQKLLENNLTLYFCLNNHFKNLQNTTKSSLILINNTNSQPLLMKTFAQILYFSPTSKLWREAYLYYLTKQFLDNFCLKTYGNIEHKMRPMQIFIRQDKSQIHLKITSSNNYFLGEINKQKVEITSLLQNHLIKQKVISKNFQINLKTATT